MWKHLLAQHLPWSSVGGWAGDISEIATYRNYRACKLVYSKLSLLSFKVSSDPTFHLKVVSPPLPHLGMDDTCGQNRTILGNWFVGKVLLWPNFPRQVHQPWRSWSPPWATAPSGRASRWRSLPRSVLRVVVTSVSNKVIFPFFPKRYGQRAPKDLLDVYN